MRISLRELMIVVAVVAMGCAGLKYASTPMLSVVQLTTGVCVLGFLVRAALDRGRGRAFAIGFLVWSTGYALAAQVLDIPSPPANNWPVPERKVVSVFLPTRLWLSLRPSIASRQWIDANTGRPLWFDPTMPLGKLSGATGPHMIQGTGLMKLNGLPIGHPVMSWDELEKERLFTHDQVANAMMRADINYTRYAYLPLPWDYDLVCLCHCYGVLALGYVGGRLAQLARVIRRPALD